MSITTPDPYVGQKIIVLDGHREALDSLPHGSVVAAHGKHDHTLYAVSHDWYVLVGPDDLTSLNWVARYLPADREWTATFETYSDTLLTHFTPL